VKIEIEIDCDNEDLGYEQIKQMVAKTAREINETMKDLIESEIDFEHISGNSKIQPKGRFYAEDQITPFHYRLQIYSND
jgi:hypothetical protein